MKRFVCCLCLGLMCLFGFSVFAQPKMASGVVISAEDNEPIIGAAVTVKGRVGVGTATDFDGKFTLQVPGDVTTLVVSYIGMVSQEIPVKIGQKIVMRPSQSELEEVVVVSTGMGQQDKRTFTGAAKKIEAADVQLSGVADISRSLEGRVAGVQVTNVSGTFGAAPKIRVRGATSIYGNSKPLWVVDGVILEDNVDVSADDLSSGDAKTLISSAVAGLNSDDIESFTVLKDGSATSIYGARAMAGVIVIETKKGRKGHSSVNYTGEFTMRRKPSYKDYNIMNSQEIMGVYKEMENKGWLQIDNMVNAENTGIYGRMYQLIRQYDATTGQFGMENTEAARNAYLQEAEFRNTDWFDLLFENNLMQNHSVSVSTGTDRSQSYFSMSVMNDPGWYKQSKVQRYTFNGNTSYEIIKDLTVKFAAQGSHRTQHAPGSLDQSTDVVSGEVKRDFDINPFSFALNSSRALDPYYNYTRFYTDFNIFDELNYNYNKFDVNDIMFRAELNYRPIMTDKHSLTLNGLISARFQHTKLVHNVMDDSNQANAYRAGTDEQDDNSTVRYSNPLLYTDPDDDSAIPESVLPEGGIMYQNDYNMRSTNYRFTAQYKGVFNDMHSLDAFGGMEISTVKRESTRWTGWGYQYNNGGIVHTPYLWLKQGNEENTDYFANSFTTTNQVAFFGTATYTFDQKYTLNGTLRYEGTNRLGKTRQSRWLPTWNISGRYNIDQESWFEPLENIFNSMQLRASYSLTADMGPSWVTNAQAVFMTQNVWRPTTSASESEIYISDLANSELTYEKKHEFNIGADMSFLNGRLSSSFDWYMRKNFDLIGKCYTQGVGGQIGKYANVADMDSHGFEFSISSVNFKTKDFSWNTDLIYSFAKNEITNLETSSRAIDLVSGSGYAIEGYPVRSLFSYQFKGLTDEGLPLVVNELGQTTMGDIDFQETKNLTDFLKYEGPSDPTYFGSLNNTLRYKDWTVDIYITYSGGNVVRLDPVFSYAYSDLASLPREFKNRWMAPGDEEKTNIPTIASRNTYYKYGYELGKAYNAYNYSTARIAHGDFVRLKEVAVTYNVPKTFLEKYKLSTMSMKLATTNLCLLYADKKLNGQDPEFFNTGGVASPLSKQFTLTLRIGF